MIPGKYQLWGWGILVVYTLTGAWQKWAFWLEICPLLLWGLILLIAARQLYREGSGITLFRDCAKAAAVGQSFTMSLHIKNCAARTLQLRLYDHYPQTFQAEGMPVVLKLAADAQASIDYYLTPRQRGAFTFAGVQVRYPGRWQLWQRSHLLAITAEVRVFPVFAKGNKQGFRSIALPRFGQIHPLHSRSGNGDFDHLRAYRAGDPLNRIDHKATARLGIPVSREYAFEHDQPIGLLIDCSRRMANIYNQHTLLDEVLNAAVLLAQTALEQGDEVSMLAFSATLQRYLPAGRRHHHYARLMEQLYDLYADNHPPDFLAAAEEYYRRQRKRSLVIIITVLQDGDGAAMQAALRLLRRRHHVLLVSVRLPVLDAYINIQNKEDAVTAALRDDYANRFGAMQQQLAAEQLWFVKCRPEQLRVQVVNIYLKYKHLLRR